ncbi:MAG TPA: alpha/beta hydrolase [Verrucomicrobiae bacterium]|nr:alpha/beta hydrolase [Verrucomicrobiae bacterium]
MMKPLAVWVGLILAAGGTVFAQRLGPRDVDALPASEPKAVLPYGAEALQFGELRLPPGPGPFALVVVIHGGCWTRGFATVRNTAALASALAARGVATWNVEYRQVGDEGGGWPGTFQDWGAAVDYARELAKRYPLDLTRVAVIGHSAGAHAALWVAARERLPATSRIRGARPLRVAAAVALDGPGDLTGFVGFDAQVCGRPVVAALMGGTPAEKPERYRQASPQGLLPLGTPQFLVSAAVLTADKAAAYQKLARAKGDAVEILSPKNAGHFEIIAPGQPGGDAVIKWILGPVMEAMAPKK